MGRPSGDSDELGAEVHDFQLQRQIQELRDERDRTRKAALDGANTHESARLIADLLALRRHHLRD